MAWDGLIPRKAGSATSHVHRKLRTRHFSLSRRVAADVDQLRDLFKQDVRKLHIVLTSAEPYVLNDADSDIDPGGLAFAGKRLVLEAADPATLAVIRFKATPTGDGKPAAALAVSGKAVDPGTPATGASVSLRGIRFECDGGPNAPASAIVAADLDKLDVRPLRRSSCRNWPPAIHRGPKSRPAPS